jgi:alpha-D-ribose 1-methylphosphonate 5-triphosphate synthase subunit PhnH
MIDLPGFADPVGEAQSCFRAVLGAMARPGTLHAAGLGLTPPAPLDPATAAVLLTLVDGETRLAMDGQFAPAAAWIAFHCGVAPDAAPENAGFVLAGALPRLAGLACGTDEMPEASATVILQLPALGRGRDYAIAGPGLARPARFAVAGLPADFVARWADNHALYPRGVDLILCAGTQLAALPRSLRITEG